MSALTPPPAFGGGLTGGRSRTLSWPVSARGEFAVIFALSASAFFALGVFLLSRHVVYADAESRLTHAYMVLWNRPAKLASIGFVWPPFQTLALLPFVLVKGVATSLVALPLFSALWAGAMVATLNRTLSLIGLAAGWRLALLVAWAANPIFLDYSANGMAEIQFMALMAAGLHYYVAWWLGGGRSFRQISLAGVFVALAFMTRFEVGAWILVMAAGIIAVRWPTRRRRADVTAPVLLFVAPTAYMAAVWSVISMMIVGGGPLSWLTRAGGQGWLGANTQGGAAHLTLDVVRLTSDVSPALWVVPILLVGVALLQRSRLGVVLALCTLLGSFITLALLLHTPTLGLLQPRYNIRSLGPLAVAAGWLLVLCPRGWARTTVGAMVVASLLAAIPAAEHLMVTDRHGEESAFAHAVTTGHSQEGTTAPPNYRIGTDQDRYIAQWINRHTAQAKSVLIDDASFPGVILLSGRPTLFRTLVDHGEGPWLGVMRHPWGHVRYMMVGNPSEVSSGFAGDLISMHFPDAYAGGLPGTRVIYRDHWGALLAVSRQEPVSAAVNDAVAQMTDLHRLKRRPGH